MEYIERIIDVNSGKITNRNYTAEEINKENTIRTRNLVIEQTEQAKAAVKATAKSALLERLGISADEAALLLS